MHFNFDFSARLILWTLTFAAQLVLLVVLLGRDRMRRYPWFSAGIALYALRLMAERLLAGRIAVLNLQEILLVLNDLAAVVALLVVVEVARRAFAGAGRSQWTVNAVGMLAVAVVVLVVWGPWPAVKEMGLDTLLGKLRLMNLLGQKGNLLDDLLLVQLGLLVVVFGKKYKAAWRSHAQMIVIGLAAVAATELATQQVWRILTRSAHPHSQAEYNHLVDLGGRLLNINNGAYLAALLWWIVWLWLDEPGSSSAALTEPEAQDPGKL